MHDSQRGSGAAIGVVAAVIGLVAGMLVASAYGGKQYDEKLAVLEKDRQAAQAAAAALPAPVPATDTKAADLRVLLSALMRQHVNLASAAVRSGYNNSADFQAVAGALDANSVEIAKAIGTVYGAEAQETWLASWRSHIGFFVDYAKAAKKGDKKAMDEAAASLAAYVDGVADFLSKANPHLPKEVVAQAIGEHARLMRSVVDAYGAGDTAKSYAEQAKADAQIGAAADAVSGAIVKQFPEKF